jgi:gentisate 1,2-dioxygenase
MPFDLSPSLQTNYAATSPNLLAGYLRVNATESFTTDFVATSQMYFVIHGTGSTLADQGTIDWKAGDLFTLPSTSKAFHQATADSVLFWVNDAPLLSYLVSTEKNIQRSSLNHEFCILLLLLSNNASVRT